MRLFIPRIMPYLICGLAALFYVYDYFIQVSPAVITDQLMATFHVGAAGLSFLGACFFYAYASMQIPAGLLLDRFGPRKLLSCAILISGIGVILFSRTDSYALAGFARFLIGFGSSFAFISTLFLASRWFEHRHFAFIAGLVQMAGCLGSMVGEAPLAHLINLYGWRETLFVTGWITLLLAILYVLIIRDQPGQLRVKSKKGGIALELGRLRHVLKLPQVWWSAWCGFFSWVPVATLGALWGVPYLVKVYGWSSIKAAGFCSLFWIALAVSSPLVGWFSDSIKSRNRPIRFCFISGIIGGILLFCAPFIPYWITAMALILLGICAAVQSLTFGVIKDFLPSSVFGTASGFLNMMAIAAGGISQQLVGLVLALTWGHQHNWQGVPIYSVQSYQLAILLLPLAALVGWWISAYKLKETNCVPILEAVEQGA